MRDINEMEQGEIENYLDEIEEGTYTCELILTKYEHGLGIEIVTEEVDEIVKVIISFGWNAAMEGENFNMADTEH